jgi:hypothetical protein
MSFREQRVLTCDELGCGEHFALAANGIRPMAAFEAYGWSLTEDGMHRCPGHTKPKPVPCGHRSAAASQGPCKRPIGHPGVHHA